MKPILSVLTLGVLLTLTGVGRTNEPAAVGKLSASGKVVGLDGKPIPGATVYLRQWPSVEFGQKSVKSDKEVLATTTTDNQGRFAFKDVTPFPFEAGSGIGSQSFPWDLIVKAKGHGLGFKPLTAQNQQRSLLLTLGPEAHLRGRLVDRGGKPLSGVKVQVTSLSTPAQKQQVVTGPAGYYDRTGDVLELKGSQFQPTATSNAEGRFVLSGLPKDHSVLLVIADDRFIREPINAATTDKPQGPVKAGVPGQMVEYPVYTGDFTLTLTPGHFLQGQVVCADTGTPVAAAEIRLYGQNQCFPTTTDKEGRFRIAQLAPGKHQLLVFAPLGSAYLGTQTNVDVPANRRKVEQQVQLQRGVLVQGRVVDEETGKGLAGVPLDYEGAPAGTGSFASSVRTDADGSFRLAVPPGKGKVRVLMVPPGYYLPREHRGPGMPGMTAETEAGRKEQARYRKEVDARPDQPIRGVVFTIGRGRVITGRVLDPEGQPVPGARVSRPSVLAGAVRPVGTDASGRFTLSGLPPDQAQELAIIHPERKLGAQVTVPAQGGTRPAPLEIKLQPLARAAGRVLDESRKPIADAPVTLMVKQTSQGMTFYASEPTSVQSDRQGKFTLDTLLPGTDYIVQVTAEGYAGAQTPQFTAQSGPPHALGDLTLARADQSVAGVVVDPTGKPLADIQVYAYPQRSGVALSRFEQVKTDRKGRFRIGNLPGSPIQVTATGPTREAAGGIQVASSARMLAEAGNQDVRIVMFVPPAQHPAGAVVGKPAPEFPVRRWLQAGTGVAKPSFTPAAFQGKVVLLAFLDEAKPSQRLLPALDRLHARFLDRGLVIVRVYEQTAGRRTGDKGEDELARLSLTPAVLVPPGLVPGGYSAAFQRYGVRATPTLFLIDRQGILRDADPDQADLEGRIKELLGR